MISSGAASGLLFSGTAFGTFASANAFAVVVSGGALAGGVATGNLKGAVKGALIAAVTYGIGHGGDGGGQLFSSDYAHYAAHGVVSGISAEVDGGQFGHGFASAFLSQLAGGSKRFGSVLNSEKIGRAVISNAILQGSISEMTGGKFANGAMSAAFRVAFNDKLSDKSDHRRAGVKSIAKALKDDDDFEFGEEKAKRAYITAYSTGKNTKRLIKRKLELNGNLTDSQIDFALEFAVVLSTEMDTIDNIGKLALSGGRSSITGKGLVGTGRKSLKFNNEDVDLQDIMKKIDNNYPGAGIVDFSRAAIYGGSPNGVYFRERFGEF